MIFVTLGTQRFPFCRIINQIEKMRKLYDGKIVIQCGYTNCDIDGVITYKFMDSATFMEYINEAKVVVTHGGTSSIIKSINANKKVIAVPRLQKYKEHVDNHQLEICETLENKGYIAVLNEDEELYEKVELVIDNTYNSYESDKLGLLYDITDYINNNRGSGL